MTSSLNSGYGSYTIEDGVPLPKTAMSPRRGRKGVFPLLDMKVGQSIRVSEEMRDRARVAVTNANTNHADKGMRWVCGYDGEGQCRIWRAE